MHVHDRSKYTRVNVLAAAEMRVLRKIAGVSRLDHVRNEAVRERLRLELVLKKVERRRAGREVRWRRY